MSLWRIAWSYLWNRRFTTVMTIVSVALGVALISTVLTLREETRKRFEEEGQAFDVVVGAKGNPLQLVLSAVYFLDAPTGNIRLSDYEKLAKEEGVLRAFPLNMGDNYRGFRIVGVPGDFLRFEWSRREGAEFKVAEGRIFDKPFEVVVGAAVSEDVDLNIDDTFTGTCGIGGHGHVHKRHPYTVVGALERTGTPFDRAIYCSLESVWDVHESDPAEPGEEDAEEDHDHEYGVRDQITAVLVKLEGPAMRPDFVKRVNQDLNVMAVVPINEIRKLYDQLLGTAKLAMLAMGFLVVIVSSITILIGLYMAILQRKRDLAIMRALGASKGEIFGAVLIEAFWVTVLGLIAGWCLGTATCAALGSYLVEKVGFRIATVSMTPDLVSAYSIVVLVGLVAGILPAWQAYRTDVARDLAEL